MTRFADIQSRWLILRHDIKATLVHGWPYLKNRLSVSPPESLAGVKTRQQGELEVHVLTCHRDFAMMLWAALSYYLLTGRDDPFVVHDDGTLCRSDAALLMRFFPAARVVDPREAAALADRELRACPLLRRLRGRLKHMWKLTDFAATCRGERFIILDSDQIFFKPPWELVEADNSQGHIFLRDATTRYALDPAEVQRRTGVSLPEQVACGLANVAARVLSWGAMEDFLRQTGIDVDSVDIWVEQMLWAFECARTGFRFLPDSYRVGVGPGTEGLVAKHYVGILARDLFYVEALPILRQILARKAA
jgi:hypothetical protein